MKYQKYDKRKFYETWHTKSCGCNVYIYKLPHKEIYHFAIVCPEEFNYSCLENGEIYYSFNDVDVAVETWLNKNLRQ